MFVDITEEEVVHVRRFVPDGKDWKPLASDHRSRVATGARDEDAWIEFGAKVSEERSKDALMDDEGHSLGRGTSCGVPFLTTNADHIGREFLDGERPIGGQLDFPGTSGWVSPVAPITFGNLVVAIKEMG